MVNETKDTVLLFANPDSRVRRLRYMKYINVVTNNPVGGTKFTAHRMTAQTAKTIVRNLRARGFEAACETVPTRAEEHAAESAAFNAKQALRTPEQVAFETLSTRAGDDAFHNRMRRAQHDDYLFMRGFNNRHED